jgi:hypothetical protein
VNVKSEVTIKFSGELPQAIAAPNKKVEITFIDHNGLSFTALINKAYRKAEASVSEFADWAGMVSGKLGKSDNGFEIIDAGIQIFEKKPKEPKLDSENSD